jgi:hypothetical protein
MMVTLKKLLLRWGYIAAFTKDFFLHSITGETIHVSHLSLEGHSVPLIALQL